MTRRWRQLHLPFLDDDTGAGAVEKEACAPEAPVADSGQREAAKSDLAVWLSDRLGMVIQVIFTENHRTLFSFRQRRQGGVLRIHRIFARADDKVREALLLFLNDQKQRSRPILQAFADANREMLRPEKPTSVRQKGRIFDLGDILCSLNERYFGGRLQVEVSWAKRGRRPRRAVRLGSFDAERRLIRVNPVLDHPSVPRYVVEEVLFHEMIHAEIGIEDRGGRRRVHGPDFRLRERAFPHRRAAQEWLNRRLADLLNPS